MHSEQQEHVARAVAEVRAWVDEVMQHGDGEMALRSLPRIAARLDDVEAALLVDARVRGRHLSQRARYWAKPRLTALRHHPAEPLTVPAHYLRTNAPRPAPRISIVTPSYQQEQFLERTIYSVVSQHYPNLEYVVQDGGSGDGTVEILRRYEQQLAGWESDADGGQAAALNRGFGRTSGEIMAYLNSDDLLLPGSLAYVASYFAAHPETHVVYGHRLMLDASDGKIGAWVLPPHDDRMLSYADYVPQETLFWRRSAWEAVGGRFDESLRFAMDWDLLLRMRDAGQQMARVPRYLGAFRVHAEQKTQSAREDFHAEAARLLHHANGRTMTLDEAFVRVRPYLRRHVVHHNARRAIERLPGARVRVRTLPPA